MRSFGARRRPVLLDMFCGAGGAAVGYSMAGFDVVGLDIRPQPSYPFTFVLGDALRPPFDLREFDAIHASPPCQRYSIATAARGTRDRHPDLIEPLRAMLDRSRRPWVMENVPGSPLRNPLLLCGRMFGLRVLRHRWFESSVLLLAPSHDRHPRGEHLTNGHRGYSTAAAPFVTVAGHNFLVADGKAAMGIGWMRNRCELANAVPPAYTQYLGRQLLRAVTGRDGGPARGGNHADPPRRPRQAGGPP